MSCIKVLQAESITTRHTGIAEKSVLNLHHHPM